jgi:hypothetical protein
MPSVRSLSLILAPYQQALNQFVCCPLRQVLSPVRRSTRKAARHVLAAEPSAVTPMLEATNYCYQGRGDSQQQPFGQ